MNKWRNSWKTFSLSLFVIWAVIFLLVWKLDTHSQLESVALIFYGYFVGWLTATIKIILINRDQPPKS